MRTTRCSPLLTPHSPSLLITQGAVGGHSGSPGPGSHCLPTSRPDLLHSVLTRQRSPPPLCHYVTLCDHFCRTQCCAELLLEKHFHFHSVLSLPPSAICNHNSREGTEQSEYTQKHNSQLSYPSVPGSFLLQDGFCPQRPLGPHLNRLWLGHMTFSMHGWVSPNLCS